MTTILEEPFNDLAAWTPSGSPTIVAGRNGNGLRMSGTSTFVATTIPTPAESATVVVGFAYRTSTVGVSNGMLIAYSDTNATLHDRFEIDTDGSIRVRRNLTSVAQSAAGLVTANVWNYYELRLVLGDAPNGAVIARLNNIEVFNVTGIDTKNGGTKTVFDTIRLGIPGNSVTSTFDDLYLLTGSTESFRGDTEIGVVPPRFRIAESDTFRTMEAGVDFRGLERA